MATKKYRLNRKNSDGTYDVIHYETSSNIVMRPDGSTVEESLLNSDLPSGIIAMWSGAADAIPSGWALCDGSNNTPDLRNRFIVGAGSSYSVGNTGGSNSVTLTTAQMPSHTHGHSLSAASGGSHTHGNSFSISMHDLKIKTRGWGDGNSYMSVPLGGTAGSPSSDIGKTVANLTVSGSGSLSGYISSAGSHSHSISGSISSAGSGAAHENRPPYYALCFIMKK